MSDFMHSHWHIHSSIYWKTYQDVTHDFIVPDDYEHARDFYIAAVPDRKDARLIAAAPEMYNWIEKTCCFLHDLKRYAHDEDEMRDHAEDLNATYNNLLTDAYLMLVRIDGEEAQS